MKNPIRLAAWFGLASLLALCLVLACDNGSPSQITEGSAAKPDPTRPPAASPTPAPTSEPPSPVSTQTSVPTSTPIPTLAPEPNATSTATAVESSPPLELLITVSGIPGELPSYDRKEWRHWTDEDGDCQNARHEVLIDESRSEVTYKSDRECQVVTGEWFGAFTGKTVLESGDLDIDHLVPLKNAHLSGGWAWSPDQKERYANSLDDPGHLIAVTKGANRSKGAKGPDEWRPPNESYWCEYAVAWITVKLTWELTATPAEAEALEDMLGTCTSPPSLTVITSEPASVTTSPTPTPVPGSTPGSAGVVVYDSCDDATKAGEVRVQGDSGPGRGFPQAMVPSAGDGDGDGTVCEE